MDICDTDEWYWSRVKHLCGEIGRVIAERGPSRHVPIMLGAMRYWVLKFERDSALGRAARTEYFRTLDTYCQCLNAKDAKDARR